MIGYIIHAYNLDASFTSPIFSRSWYFLRTDSLWYYMRGSASVAQRIWKDGRHGLHRHEHVLTFQNCLLASLPPTLFKIFAPPGCLQGTGLKFSEWLR